MKSQIKVPNNSSRHRVTFPTFAQTEWGIPMFSWLSAPEPPLTKAGRLCFDLINQIRARRGHKIKHPLPTELGENPEFVGILLGIMDLVSARTGESNFLVSNTEDLFLKLWGTEPGSTRHSQGMRNAIALMRNAADNDVLLSSLERAQVTMLESPNMEQDMLRMIERFF